MMLWRSRVASRSSSHTTFTLKFPSAPILLAPSAIVAPSSEFPLAPVVPVTLEVRAAAVASPARVIKLDTYSSSEADPLESSPPPVSIAPMVLPSLCSDDSKSDTEIPERHVSPTTSTSEIHTAPILPAPSAIDTPIGRLYRTYPGGPCKALTARKSVRFLPSHRLALRHSSSGHSLSGRTPPDTIDADSSTLQRFVHPPLARTPRCSEAYLHWRSAPISTIAFVPSRTDLLPPRKRFRDSISLEDNVEEDIDTNVLEDIEADATTVEVAVDRDVEAEIDIEVGVDMDAGIDIPDGMLMPDAVEHLEQRTLRLLRDSWRLVASRERAGLSDRTRSSERENIKVQALLSIKRDWVDSLHRHKTLSQEEFRQVRKDRDDTQRRLRR
nr:hypothetical protein [Tanacetum cinerariifolium]